MATPNPAQQRAIDTTVPRVTSAGLYTYIKGTMNPAMANFATINPDNSLLAAMLTAIERAKKSSQWTKENGQFIPYPATWLRAKGWEDELFESGNTISQPPKDPAKTLKDAYLDLKDVTNCGQKRTPEEMDKLIEIISRRRGIDKKVFSEYVEKQGGV